MKNAFVCLLGALLAGCFIWACSLSSENAGLAFENAKLQRKYQVLQTLYTQTKEEADALRGESDAGKAAWSEKTALLDLALRQFQAMQTDGPGAASTPAGKTDPEETPDGAPLTGEPPESIFTVPLPTPAAEEAEAQPLPDGELTDDPAATDAPEESQPTLPGPENNKE